MRWWLVAILAGRMEAFDMGPPLGARERCFKILGALEREKVVDLPQRLSDMIALDVVIGATCLDEHTMKIILKAPNTIEDAHSKFPTGAKSAPITSAPQFRTPQIGAQPQHETPLQLYRWPF